MERLNKCFKTVWLACLTLSLMACTTTGDDKKMAAGLKKDLAKLTSINELENQPLTPEQMDGGLAQVVSVDFGPLSKSNRSRLMIKTDKLVQAAVSSENQGKTVLMTVKPATMAPEHIKAISNAKLYGSAISGLSCAVKPDDVLELKVNLQSPVPYQLGQKGLSTYLDFDNPARPASVGGGSIAIPVVAAIGTAGLSFAPVANSAGAADLVTPLQNPAPAAAPGEVLASGAADTSIGGLNYNLNPGVPKQYTGQLISLDFQNADIHNILRLIGEVSGKNVVVSDTVSGKVTLKLKDVPWDQALDIVLAANGLGVVQSGNILRIDRASTLKTERAEQIMEIEQAMGLNQKGPLVKKIFTPKYAAVETLKNELSKLKSERGKIYVIGNDIYAEDDPGTIAGMNQIFLRNDQVARQVLIEARIIETNASFERSLGLNFGLNYDNRGSFGLKGDRGTISGSTNWGNLDLSTSWLSQSSTLLLDARINASEQLGDTKVISSPRIMAANDEEVYIKQGTEIPFKSVDGDGNIDIEFKDADLELRVKPHIEENGQIVTLHIKLTKDTPIRNEYVSATEFDTAVAIDTKEAETRLMVKDGETVVIGGIITDTTANTENRVPGLHRIPLLGWLFKTQTVSDDKSELLIFITANIIPVSI